MSSEWYAAIAEFDLHLAALEGLAVGGLLMFRGDADYLAGLDLHERVALWFWVERSLGPVN